MKIAPPDIDALSVQTNRTDTGNARRMVQTFGDDLRYCTSRGGWYIWSGQKWEYDDRERITALAKKTILQMYVDAARTPEASERELLIRHALASESASKLRAMVELARSEPGIAVVADDLDADDWILNCENGVVDLRTGKLHEHARERLCTKMATAAYHPDAEHPAWNKLLNDATSGDKGLQGFLRRAAGYSVTGSTAEEVLFFCHGPGASGKSTYIESVRAALGDYAMVADFSSFIESRGNGNARNDIARLCGARLVTSVEVSDGNTLAAGLVKQLTGGDRIAARFFYKEHFEFTPRFTLWLVANHAPRVDDRDDAMWRRILKLPFDKSVPPEQRDPKLKETLKHDPEAKAAVLAWMVKGALEWQRVRLQVPDSVRMATEDYRQTQDPLKDFFDDRCTFDAEAECTAGRLREAYLKHCEEAGIRRVLSVQSFAERLKEKGCTSDKVDGKRMWFGVQLT